MFSSPRLRVADLFDVMYVIVTTSPFWRAGLIILQAFPSHSDLVEPAIRMLPLEFAVAVKFSPSVSEMGCPFAVSAALSRELM